MVEPMPPAPPRTDHRRFGLMVAAALFLTDQLLKWFVVSPLGLLEEGMEHYLMPFFQFTMTHNTGIALGAMKAGSFASRWLLAGVTSAIAAFVGYWLWREPNKTDVLGLGLVLGGALGNIVDRVRLGYVVDFLDLHFGTFRPFLVFNLADAAISVGVLILLARAFFGKDAGKSDTETDNA